MQFITSRIFVLGEEANMKDLQAEALARQRDLLLIELKDLEAELKDTI
jgi:hypothetical protein